MNPRPKLTRRQFVSQVSVAAAAAALLPRSLRAADASAPDRKLGVAVLGLGSYATHQIAPAFRDTKFCRLSAVITGTPSKGDHWRKKYNLPANAVYSYETMDRIADNPDIDVIYVITPPGTHRGFVERAAKAGKHVMCEKPMAPTVADCDAMIAACRAAGKKLSIGYRLQFDPHHIAMEKWVRNPATGPAKKMRGSHAFYISGHPWRVDKKLAGGGPMPDVGIYVIQAACRAAGAAPEAIIAHELPKTRPDIFNEVEEAMRWTMLFPGGATCEGYTSYADNGNDFHVDGSHGWFELHPAFGYGGISARTDRGHLDLPSIDQQAAQMDDFARCILDNRDTPVPGEMGRRDIAIIEAAYASAAAGGKRIELKL